MFIQVGNIHGNEVVGRQMLLRTISYLIEKDHVDPRVTRLLNTTDIFFLPSMNPDGFVKAQVSFSYELFISMQTVNRGGTGTLFDGTRVSLRVDLTVTEPPALQLVNYT